MKHIKYRFIEYIKYDHNRLKLPLVWIVGAIVNVLKMLSKHDKAFSVSSQIFRTGWNGSFALGQKQAKYYFFDHPLLGEKIVNNAINSLEPIGNTGKFIENPSLMLDGVITILKNPSRNEKGVFVIKYSYYFGLFLKCFNAEAIGKRFHIILEPSWAGLCEINILAYTQFDFPVFLQVYEKRDRLFIDSLNSNLIPIDVGPSWFVNHQEFESCFRFNDKDIDIIMVASWAKFKRHKAFFESIQELVALRSDLNIVLVGYPVDMSKEDIESLAIEYGLASNITLYEWIEPKEVAALQARSKVNVLWSKFEGNNRAIIEGMFCGSPAVIRLGHNYGEHYDYINNQTGCFADENNLSTVLSDILDGKLNFEPRKYVMENRNCIAATEKLNNTIREYESSRNRSWDVDLVVKTNELHGMKYLNTDETIFKESYDWLRLQLH